MTKNEKKTMKRVATKLLDLFGTDGEHWIRGDLRDDEGGYCLLGGLNQLDQENKTSLLTKAVMEHTEAHFSSVPDFNDSHYWPTIKKFLMKYAHPYQPKRVSR